MFHFLVYRTFKILAVILPIRLSYWIADGIAEIYSLFHPTSRRIIFENLSTVLKGKPERDIRSFVRATFRNFAKYLIDFLRASRMDRRFIERYVKVENREHLDNALKDSRGVIALSAHFGNWELGGIVTSLLDYPINIIALSHKNVWVNDLFVRQRLMKGVKVIPLEEAYQTGISILSRKEVLALLGDRSFSGAGIKTTFFGEEIIFPKGPALFSLRKNSPIVPVFFLREKGPYFRLVFEKPIYPPSAGTTRERMEKVACQFLRILERYIKAYPDQWLAFWRVWDSK